jgi:hypothetical protein
MAVVLILWFLWSGAERLLGDSVVPVVCKPVEGNGDVDTLDRSDASLERRIEMTSCAARERMNALVHLQSTEVSRVALELAAAPTFDELDDIERIGSAKWQVIAEQVRGDLYISMAVRLRNAPGDVESSETKTHVTGWLMRASRAYATVRRIAVEHPEVLAFPRAKDAATAAAPMLLR